MGLARASPLTIGIIPTIGSWQAALDDVTTVYVMSRLALYSYAVKKSKKTGPW
jgi:hypothetical protein